MAVLSVRRHVTGAAQDTMPPIPVSGPTLSLHNPGTWIVRRTLNPDIILLQPAARQPCQIIKWRFHACIGSYCQAERSTHVNSIKYGDIRPWPCRVGGDSKQSGLFVPWRLIASCLSSHLNALKCPHYSCVSGGAEG